MYSHLDGLVALLLALIVPMTQTLVQCLRQMTTSLAVLPGSAWLQRKRGPCGQMPAEVEGSRLLGLYEGHSLRFAIWFFNNAYNHSVYSSFSKKPPSACIPLTNLSNQLFMTPDHVDWSMSKNDALEECSGICDVLKLLSLQLPFDGREQKPVRGG